MLFLSMIAVFTMFKVFKKGEKKYDIEKLKRIHRANGIIYLSVFTLYSYLNRILAPETDIMKRPPRHKESALIDRPLLFRSYIFLGLISTVGVLFVYFYVLLQGGWRWGMDLSIDNPLSRQASTATFLGIVILLFGNVFACRSSNDSIFKLGFLSNRR